MISINVLRIKENSQLLAIGLSDFFKEFSSLIRV
jgi:hypothetical protein